MSGEIEPSIIGTMNAVATALKAMGVFAYVETYARAKVINSVASLPAAIISRGTRQFDGENPALGNITIDVTIVVQDYSMPGGKLAMTGEDGLQDLENQVISAIGHTSNGVYGPGLTYNSSLDLGPWDFPSANAAAFATTLSFNLLLG